MPRAKQRYKRYCSNIYDVASNLIEDAIVPALREWIHSDPRIKQFEQERSEAIRKAQQAVNAIDPSLKVTGPVMSESSLQYVPAWIRSSDNKQLWFKQFTRVDRVFHVRAEHALIPQCNGGVFYPLVKEYSLHHNNDSLVVLTQVENLECMPEHTRSKVLWAERQYQILAQDFQQWTAQFRDERDRRAIDLSCYFSPVFASFASFNIAKVFSSRPRYDEYIPMTKALATLLTMARASKHYSTSASAWELTA